MYVTAWSSNVTRLRLPSCCPSDAFRGEVLPCVLPNQQGGADVHVEGPGDPLLRDLHAHIQHLEQVGRNTFPFIARMRETQR